MKKQITDIEIGRRLADYPPEFLHYLGLISLEEYHRINLKECHTSDWRRYRRGVAYKKALSGGSNT